MAADSCFRDIRWFVFCLGSVLLFENYVSSIGRGVLTTIERRFALSSSAVGVLASSFQMSNMFVQPFVSYFGGKSHRPRWIAIGGLIVAVGSTSAFLPQFIDSRYEYEDTAISNLSSNAEIMLCNRNSNYSDNSCGSGGHSESNKLYIFIIIGGILHGIGASPFQPLGMSYLDDFSPPAKAALYIGIAKGILLIGPALGYLASAVILNIWVDVGWTDPDITPSNPNWVGAWWMGYMIGSITMISVSIPFFFFPYAMESHQSVQVQKKEDTKKAEKLSTIGELKQLFEATKRLLTNPKLLLIHAILVFASLVVVGVATFFPKYLEVQFGETASRSNLLHGSINLPAVISGTLLGGVIVSKTNPNTPGLVKMVAIVLLLASVTTYPLLFIGCDTQDIEGVTVFNSSNTVTNDCNKLCDCEKGMYSPVCSIDTGVIYVSPCHAGCTTEIANSETPIQNFTSCSCTQDENIESVLTSLCKRTTCRGHEIAWALLFKALANFFGGLSVTPNFMLILRVVDIMDKAYAIGLTFLAFRVLAWLPGPMLYGSIIDSTCIYWGRNHCGERGNCKVYNNSLYRFRYYGIMIIFQTITVLSCFALFFVTKRETMKSQDSKRSGVINQKSNIKNQNEDKGYMEKELKKLVSPDTDGGEISKLNKTIPQSDN
ncbi:solute carrier organic anion transporter family member 2A1-like [Styela clava]